MAPEPADAAVLVEVADVDVRYGRRAVLDRVGLSVRRGEIVTLVGPNGSGKTTLVRVVLGLLAPDAGVVRRRAGLRVGYVPQRLSVERTLPLTVRRFLAMAGRRPAARLRQALAEVGAPGILESSFHELSGGEAKRAALARALLRDPDLLVLDEPMANVDVAGQAEFYDLVRAIRDRRDCAVLLVSHDLHLVMGSTDFVVCLNGHVCCSGRPAAVSRDPEYLALFGPRVAETLGLYAHDHDHRHAISGEAVDAADGGGGGHG